MTLSEVMSEVAPVANEEACAPFTTICCLCHEGPDFANTHIYVVILYLFKPPTILFEIKVYSF